MYLYIKRSHQFVVSMLRDRCTNKLTHFNIYNISKNTTIESSFTIYDQCLMKQSKVSRHLKGLLYLETRVNLDTWRHLRIGGGDFKALCVQEITTTTPLLCTKLCFSNSSWSFCYSLNSIIITKSF